MPALLYLLASFGLQPDEGPQVCGESVSFRGHCRSCGMLFIRASCLTANDPVLCSLHIAVATGKEGEFFVLIMPALLCLLASSDSQPDEGPQVCGEWVSFRGHCRPCSMLFIRVSCLAATDCDWA